MNRHILPILLVLLCATPAASAASVDWNTWTSPSTGALTSGNMAIAVGYDSADAHTIVANYPSWTPAATFADGSVVDNGPLAGNGIMRITGGTATVNTITFSSPVVDPVLAIWSLGSLSLAASFHFINLTPALVSGGSNSEYGGSSLVVNNAVVSGNEGNGTVRFAGTYTALSWTNPDSESWYGFNVGIASAVPEPGMFALLLAGLLPIAWRVRRR